MNTTAAATQAHVTIATIRTWCRRGVIDAAKVAGRWVIDAASLSRRIEIGARRMTQSAPLVEQLGDTILSGIRRARLGYSPRRADRDALAGRYVVAHPYGANRIPSLWGEGVWREYGLIDEVTTGGRTYYVLSAKAEQLRAQLAA
jgi:hypothetical protein